MILHMQPLAPQWKQEWALIGWRQLGIRPGVRDVNDTTLRRNQSKTALRGDITANLNCFHFIFHVRDAFRLFGNFNLFWFRSCQINCWVGLISLPKLIAILQLCSHFPMISISTHLHLYSSSLYSMSIVVHSLNRWICQERAQFFSSFHRVGGRKDDLNIMAFILAHVLANESIYIDSNQRLSGFSWIQIN